MLTQRQRAISLNPQFSHFSCQHQHPYSYLFTIMSSAQAHAGMAAISSLATDKVITRRWKKSLPKSLDYYYDEPVLVLTKKSKENDFPPDEMDLSDTWVTAIVKSSISADERFRRWGCVFTQRGLRSSYTHKGKAAKAQEPGSPLFRYVVIFRDGSENDRMESWPHSHHVRDKTIDSSDLGGFCERCCRWDLEGWDGRSCSALALFKTLKQYNWRKSYVVWPDELVWNLVGTWLWSRVLWIIASGAYAHVQSLIYNWLFFILSIPRGETSMIGIQLLKKHQSGNGRGQIPAIL